MTTINNLLENCGLNRTEQAVLLFLFKNGSSYASLISKGTGLKRPTVYASIDNLKKLGLVSIQKKGNITCFNAVAPDDLPKIILTRAREEFEQKERLSKVLSANLKDFVSIPRLDLGNFKVTVFDTEEGIYSQLEKFLFSGDFNAFFNPQVVIQGNELMRSMTMKFLEETAKTKPNIREIVVFSQESDWYLEKIKNPNHKVKLLHASPQLFLDIIISKNSVYMADYHAPDQMGVVIDNGYYSHTLQAIFELMWSTIK